jgi:hypothetical protein
MATILVGSTGFADDMIISGRTPCGGNRMVDVADLIDDDDFVLAMARFADGVWTESQIKRKFRFDDATWQKLGSDDRLVEKIEALKELRIRRGDTKRERAQQRVIQAPQILEAIMLSDASPKHRIDAAKALDAFANGPEAAAPAASAGQFLIQIVLSPNEIIRYPQSDDKTTEKLLDVSPKVIEHGAHNNDDDETEQLATPWGLFLTATNKQGSDGNGGQPL